MSENVLWGGYNVIIEVLYPTLWKSKLQITAIDADTVF